jgi:hypothetical protein
MLLLPLSGEVKSSNDNSITNIRTLYFTSDTNSSTMNEKHDVNHHRNDKNKLSDVALSPSSITYNSTDYLSTTYLSLSSTLMEQAVNASTVAYKVLISGPSAEQYNILYPRGNTIKYILANVERDLWCI